MCNLREIKILALLLLFTSSCLSTTNENTLEESVFSLRSGDNAAIVNLDSIQTVHELYRREAHGNPTFKLILPYSFSIHQFQQKSSTGIAVMGHPMKRWIAKSERYSFRFEFDDNQNWLANFEELNFNYMDSLVRVNMINSGYDPSLSDNPKDTLFEIIMKEDTEIRNLTQIFTRLTSSYLSFVNQKSKEYESVDSLIKDYPLHIMISENTPTSQIDSTLREEIERQIEIGYF